MKAILLWACLIIAIIALCVCTLKLAIAGPRDIGFNAEVETTIQEHTLHTHEHAGLACCPCGMCHRHDENSDYSVKAPALSLRLLALGIFESVMLVVITGIFCV